MDRVIERIRTLLAPLVNSRGIKIITNGHPFAIPLESLPAIIVRGSGISSSTLDTTRDQEQYDIQIILMADSRTYLNVDETEFTAERKIRQIFEERDTNNELKSTTILSIIQKSFSHESAYCQKIKVNSLVFGAGIDPVLKTEFPGVFGVLSLTIFAVPYRIK